MSSSVTKASDINVDVFDCLQSIEVDCECYPEFSSYSDGTTAILEVGNLVSDTCTFDGYVIDWYHNSINNGIEFTSGVGDDPDITYYHPMTGGAALPVEGGLWIPVIRYVTIGGIDIYNGYIRPGTWCADLDTLPTITVNSYDCGVPAGGASSPYTHKISYNATINNPLTASRSVRLNIDATIKHVAWRFDAYLVADRMILAYCRDDGTEVSVLLNLRLGSDAGGYSAPPYDFPVLYSVQNEAGVVTFDGIDYESGDYLKITIYPSEPSGNSNTNWIVSLKCLDETYDCYSDLSSYADIDVSQIACEWDSGRCAYKWAIRNTSFVYADFDLLTYYLTTVQWPGNMVNANMTTGIHDALLYHDTNYNFSGAWVGDSSCYNLAGTKTINKTGTLWTITFTDASDYTTFKNNYNNYLLTHYLYTGWSSDPADIAYYRTFSFYARYANSCGDNYTIEQYNFWMECPVTFYDGEYRVTIDSSYTPAANGLPTETCNDSSFRYGIFTGLMNTTRNLADFTKQSKVRQGVEWIMFFMSTTVRNQLSFHFYKGFAMARFHSVHSACDFSMFQPNGTSMIYWWLSFYIEVTDELAPCDNWRVYDSRMPNGARTTNVAEMTLLKEMEDGVVIYPV